MISNALLFDSKLLSDHFTPWSSPYHLLHPFMQPIMPTTILVLRKNIFYSLGGAWAWNLKFEQLGPHREKQQNLEKQKTQAKPKKQKKNFWENVWFWLRRCFFWVSLVFFVVFWFWNGKPKTTFFLFFEWIWSIKISKNNKQLKFFFQHFRFGFLHWKVSKTKTTWVYLVFLDFDFFISIQFNFF